MLGCGAMARAFAARIAVRLMLLWTLPVSALPVAAAPDTQGVTNEPCPPGAVVVEPGASIQAALDRADEGAAFCLKNGVHRLQVIRPKRGQRFHGEGRTVLNGSRFLTTFSREGPILGGEWAKAARQEKWPLRQRRSCLQSPRGLLRRRQTARPGAEQRQRRAKPILF